MNCILWVSHHQLAFRLLFATTNHIERLDPALSRPGRMDVWINFKNATKWQAEGIFRCFFPADKLGAACLGSDTSKEATSTIAPQNNLVTPKREKSSKILRSLTEDEINVLAKRFADAIPDDEFSVSSVIFICEFNVDTRQVGRLFARISPQK